MAIQPIDLQTLFTQMDKVAKSQTALREGIALHQDLQGIQIQRKTEEQIKAVNETRHMGEDGAEKVKDRGAQAQNDEKEKKERRPSPQEEEQKAVIFRDPRLGRNIDISL